MNPFTLRTVRQLALAGCTAFAVAAVGLVSSSAAEPSGAESAQHEAGPYHEAMAKKWAEHLQMRLDRLSERLEIKASQQAVWQKFAAAFKETMGEHAMMGHPDMDGKGPGELDAATLARRHAEHAEQHAQKLAQLADATAALQQSLSADQRLVFDEVARHFAQEHRGMGPMGRMGHEEDGEHCSGHGHEHEHEHPGHASTDAADWHAQLGDEGQAAPEVAHQ